MENQQAREQLIAELKRQGLPRAYIQRLLDEWDDHLSDLHDERNRHMNTPENKPAANHKAGDGIAGLSTHSKPGPADILNLHDRLGDPAQLAAFAAQQYRNRSFLGRHPIFTFVVLPIPLILVWLIAIFFSTFLIGQGFAWLMSGFIGSDSVADFNFYIAHLLLCHVIGAGLIWIWIVTPPLLTALFFCRLARRNHLNWRWAAAACAMVAFWIGLLFIQYTGPTRPGNGTLMVGLGFAPTSWPYMLYFILRFTTAMGICLLLVKRAQRLQKIDENRQETTSLGHAA